MGFIFGSRLACFAIGMVALVASGCGGGKMVKVEGKLTKGVQPLTMGSGEMIHLAFSGKNAKGEDAVFAADVNAADGSFVVKEIPPGKYKIVFNVTLGGTDAATLSKQSVYNKQFSVVNGKEYEITADTQFITIDTATGTITAGAAK